MGKYSLKTQISFEAAHRLYNVNTYSEECRTNIHGHSYKVTVYVSSGDATDKSGMVVDFKLLKEIIRETIEDKYDHSCILVESDPLCKPISKECNKVHIVKENPTAEWMAKQFFSELNMTILDRLMGTVYVEQVEVQETENNIAIYRED